jgi:hypothetical protein
VCVQKVLGCIKGMQQQWRQLVKVMQAAVAETAGQLQQQGGVLKQLQQQQQQQEVQTQVQGLQPQSQQELPPPAEPQLELEQAQQQQQPSQTPQQEQQETPGQAAAEHCAPVKEEGAAGAPSAAAAATAPQPAEELPAAVPPAGGAPAEGQSGLLPLPPQLQKPQQQAHLSRLALMGVLQQQMLAVQAVEKSQGEQLTQLSQVRFQPARLHMWQLDGNWVAAQQCHSSYPTASTTSPASLLTPPCPGLLCWPCRPARARWSRCSSAARRMRRCASSSTACGRIRCALAGAGRHTRVPQMTLCEAEVAGACHLQCLPMPMKQLPLLPAAEGAADAGGAAEHCCSRGA